MATWNGTDGYTDDQVTQLNKVTDARKIADTPVEILEAVSMWNEPSFKERLKTYTADEIKARQDDEAIEIARKAAINTAQEKIVTDRASAKTKLKALGLTDDELKAAFRL